MSGDVELRLTLRPHQLAAFHARRRFDVRVWHRRAGKTFARIAEQLVDALQSPQPDHRAYYLAPTYRQAKGIAWDYLISFVKDIPRTVVNAAELRVDLYNGARIQLLGAEQYDSLRGLYADDLTLDETALIPTVAWTQVLSPMIADRLGRATFMGTPQGRMNLFYDLFQYAQTGTDPEWRAEVLTYRDTDVLPPREVERMRRTMRPEEFAQELECSWNAAVRGAYYVREMEAMQAAGRITAVKPDRVLPVTCAVDLGWSDAMVCVFHQQTGTEHRIIGCRAYEGTSIPDMLDMWKQLPFRVSRVVLPHDARVHELGSGLTRQDVFHAQGCATVIAPNQGIHEGIDAVRRGLAHTWMDADECKTLVEAMLAYRSQYDEVRQVASTKPLHDWSSHYADAVRYLFLGIGAGSMTTGFGGVEWGPQPLGQLGVYV